MIRRLAVFLAFCVLTSCRLVAQQVVSAHRDDGAETALKIYALASSGCVPIAVISPGAGGTENGYAYLAEGFQRDGWLAIVVGHKESGPQKLRNEIRSAGVRGGLEDMVNDPALYRDRLMDLGAALRYANSKCKPPFVALLGHSMGSTTVMLEAGARNALGVSRGEDRFDAYVAISASGPGSIFPDHAWNTIYKPVYVLTGTRDKALEGPWETRTRPFDDLGSNCKCLGVVEGATHMDFARSGAFSNAGKLTVQTATAFLDGVRRGSCALPTVPSGMTLRSK